MLINFRYSTTLPDMVLTNAEKQKRYRDKIKADPTRERIDAENERLRWHERKKAGKVQTINQMTPREQRSQRKKWRQNYQNCKFRKEEEKKLRAQEENVCQHTPPTSPNAQLDDAQPAEGAEPMAPPACNSSRQKKKVGKLWEGIAQLHTERSSVLKWCWRWKRRRQKNTGSKHSEQK